MPSDDAGHVLHRQRARHSGILRMRSQGEEGTVQAYLGRSNPGKSNRKLGGTSGEAETVMTCYRRLQGRSNPYIALCSVFGLATYQDVGILGSV